MRIYFMAAVALNFLVDLLLLMGVGKLSGGKGRLFRYLAASFIDVGYICLCFAPGCAFLGTLLCRGLCLSVMGIVAYGVTRNGIKLTVLFGILSLAFGGAVNQWDRAGFLRLGAAAVMVILLRSLQGKEAVEVELNRGAVSLRVLALRDTGNTLMDPVTGKGVLVADAASALALLGLSQAQLADPVGTVASGVLPGLRLVPYRAVGISSGLLVAVKLENVRIGNRTQDTLVAFAPAGLGGDGNYRALVGGMA